MTISKHQKRSCVIGPRACFGLALLGAKETICPDLTIFTADTFTSAGLDRFKTKFPESLVECSIAEQTLIGSSAGFALSGGMALAVTFAPFITMRAFEMIRHSMGYMGIPLKVAGLASGVAFGQLGYTHCSIEDVSIINSVPNIEIFSLSDPSLYQTLLPSILDSPLPSYIRITGEPGLSPVSLIPLSESSYIHSIFEKSGDVIVLVSGSLTSFVYESLALLSDSASNHVSVYSLSRIKPLDLTPLLQALESSKRIILLDEGLFSGLGSIFVEAYPQFVSKTIFKFHPNEYLNIGDYRHMLSQASLSPQHISDLICQTVQSL